MSSSAKYWQQSKLLNAYYRKIAKVAVGQGGSCPVFTTFTAGYDPDLVGPDNDEGKPTVADIPMSYSSVPNAFYSDVVDASFSGDTALILCEIPQGAVQEPVQFNVIGLFDQEDTMIAAATTLPDWLTPEELDRSYLAVTFPIDESVEVPDDGGDGGDEGGDTEPDTGDGGDGGGDEPDTGDEPDPDTGDTGGSGNGGGDDDPQS